MRRAVSGLNIQYPISRLILTGKKVIETRFYPLPSKFVDKELAIIETPGKGKEFAARVVGVVIFGESFAYENEEDFYRDTEKHFVGRDSEWKWKPGKKKWGWPIKKISLLKEPFAAPKNKGIRYTKNIILS